MFGSSPQFQVLVAYGTTKLHRGLKPGEFLMDDRTAKNQAGLTEDTKFDLGNHVLLPYNDKWFEIEPGTDRRSPRMGDIGLVDKSRFRGVRAAANLDATLSWYSKSRAGGIDEVLAMEGGETNRRERE